MKKQNGKPFCFLFFARLAGFEQARDRRKKLANRRILRYALTITAGMDNQYAQAGKIIFSCLLHKIAKNAKRCTAAANALALSIRNDGKVRFCRQEARLAAFVDLHLKALCLLLVGGG